MKKPTRLFATLFVCTGLLMAGCSGGSDTGSQAAASASDTATDEASDKATTDESGGACDATVSKSAASPSASATADTAATEALLSSVTLSADTAAAPTATFDAPLAISAEAATVTDDGDGAAIAEGQLITFNYMVCDAATGDKLYSSWGKTSDTNAPASVILSTKNFGDALTKALTSAKVGARTLWAQPAVSAEQSYSGTASNPYLYVLTVEKAETLPDSASGTEVTPSDASLPAISLASGKPAVTVPTSFKDPTDLVVQPLIEGDGATVQSGQTVAVKYTGWLTNGTQFDSSWDRTAPDDVFVTAIGNGSVIQGWDQGLVGQKVGSRVLLVVPSSLGYGANGSGDTIPANSTLIFVVDILAAF